MRIHRFVRQLVRLFFISSLFISFNFDASFAQGNIKVGNFEVHPSFEVKETYNSNLFFEADGPSGEKPDSDWFTTATPGIAIKYPGERLIVDLAYKADIERYNNFTNEDTEKHDAFVSLGFISPAEKFAFTIENRYLDTKDAPSSDAQSNANLIRADRINNNLRGVLDIKFGELMKLVLDFSNNYSKYDLAALDFENNTKNKFGGGLYYKFSPKTSAVINYHYGIIDYRDAVGAENSDSKSHEMRVGIAMDPTAKISGEATVGYGKRDYDLTGFEDGDTFSVAANLVWQPRERTQINFNAAKRLEESSFGGDNSSFFNRTSLGLVLHQDIGRQITAVVDGGYINSDYPAREDDKITLGLHLKYTIKEWLSAKTNYSYQNNDSSVNDRDYKVHAWFISIGATF